jgi:hypothetical protein
MALTIDDVSIQPHPIPSGGAYVTATCRLTSDLPVESVTAYPQEGDSVAFRKQEENVFAAAQSLPGGIEPGSYSVVLVARDSEGNSARKTISVSIY